MRSEVRFTDRSDAGMQLAARVRGQAGRDPIVLALPRGGVPVGYEIARELSAPLDVWIVGKIGVPWNEDFTVGAVAEDGYVHLSPATIEYAGLSDADLSHAIETTRRAVARRARMLRRGRPRPQLRDRSVIVVDDGIATGSTVRTAVESIRGAHPRRIVLAVPVATAQALRMLTPVVDELVCLVEPSEYFAIAPWYEDFEELRDDALHMLLERARQERAATESTHAEPHRA